MNKPTDIQYANMTPHEVVEKIYLAQISPTRAWREHRGLSQQDVADRLGVSLAEYASHEQSKKLAKPMRIKIAAALHMAQELLDIHP
jgi:DNA-binding XRE family transcriptional regulator